MNDSPASEQAAEPTAGQLTPPAGYEQTEPRCAVFNVPALGFGSIQFGEPSFGRWRDFQSAIERSDQRGWIFMLRALIRRSSAANFPRPSDSIEKWDAYFAEAPYRHVDQLIAAAKYFVEACKKAEREEGNG